MTSRNHMNSSELAKSRPWSREFKPVFSEFANLLKSLGILRSIYLLVNPQNMDFFQWIRGITILYFRDFAKKKCLLKFSAVKFPQNETRSKKGIAYSVCYGRATRLCFVMNIFNLEYFMWNTILTLKSTNVFVHQECYRASTTQASARKRGWQPIVWRLTVYRVHHSTQHEKV